MSEVIHIPWPHSRTPTEAELRRLMESEGLEPVRWTALSGDQHQVQSHDYHKVVYCVEGGIWFTLPDERNRVIELEPGDRLDLPAGVRYGATVGMDGVTCLEGRKEK